MYKITIKFDDCSNTGRYANGTIKAHRKRNFRRNLEMFYRWEAIELGEWTETQEKIRNNWYFRQGKVKGLRWQISLQLHFQFCSKSSHLSKSQLFQLLGPKIASFIQIFQVLYCITHRPRIHQLPCLPDIPVQAAKSPCSQCCRIVFRSPCPSPATGVILLKCRITALFTPSRVLGPHPEQHLESCREYSPSSGLSSSCSRTLPGLTAL